MTQPRPPVGIGADTLELAQRLIACPSVTPSDAGCLELISTRLAAAGFSCERLDRGAVSNLWARHGRAAPLVCLAGHVDVVAPGPLDGWTSDPFCPTERNGFLYGRGAADMKTSVAAMVTAAERLVTAHPNHSGSVALLLTSDEEGDAVDGTAAVVQVLIDRGERIDACILGEPTSSERLGDVVKNGRRGSLNGSLTIEGTQAHIAYPGAGSNAVHLALPALTELVCIEWDGGNEFFPPTSFQISNVLAGTGATNVVPGTIDVLFNFRYSSASRADELEARVREVLDNHGLTYRLECKLAGTPFVTPPGRLVNTLSRTIEAVTGISPQLSTGGGTSDGRFLIAVAGEVAEFGPVNDSVHKQDERVRVDDIGPLSMTYEQAVETLLSV